MKLSYLNYDENVWAIDIEGDPIPSTKVWCAVCINAVSRDVVRLVGEHEVKEWFTEKAKNPATKFIGHNILGYDAPTLNRLLACGLRVGALIDTMLMSMLYNPSLEGGHSLEAWGSRLKFPKLDYKDFSAFTPEMLRYCERDTELCLKVYLALISRMLREGFTEDGIDLEHKSWYLIKRQQEHGFPFNEKEAHILYAKLGERLEDLRGKIYHHWPPELKIVQTYKQARKKDGTYTANYLKHKEQYVRVQETNDGGYYAYDYVEFNLASPDQRRQKLLELGWKPKEFTKPSKTFPQGQAKMTDKGSLVPSLLEFVEESGNEQVKLLATWLDLNARATMINTWLEAYNDKTGRIHGNLWLANTLRYKHSNPNTANIPAVRINKEGEPLRGEEGAYTYEARDLWTCSDPVNRRLVGVDAKGIQLRVLAHHLNNKEFTKAILSADPHETNKQNMNLPSRALTKTITYAILMGAGLGRIASEAKTSLKEAKAAQITFFEQVPELPDLIYKLKEELKKTGRITLCDGSRIIVPKDYRVIPFLLQGDESRIMRKAALITYSMCLKKGIDAVKVGDIHDEHQYDVAKKDVEKFIEILGIAFLKAGEAVNYNLPIECDAKVGLTWSETH